LVFVYYICFDGIGEEEGGLGNITTTFAIRVLSEHGFEEINRMMVSSSRLKKL